MDTQLNVRPTLPVLARTVSGCLNSPFLGLFWTSCGPSFSGHGYPAQRAAKTSCPRSDRFRLRQLRVSRTFLDFLRLICSVHGSPARRAAKVGRGHPRFLGARKWAPPSAPIRRSVSGSTQRGKVCARLKLVWRGSLDLPEPAQQFSRHSLQIHWPLTTGHWPLFSLTSFREPGTPRP